MSNSDQQQNLRRKRRWLVPVVLVSLLLLVAGVLAGLAMCSPSSLSINEAEELFDRLTKKDGVVGQRTFDTPYSEQELIGMLGKPIRSTEQFSLWRFTRQTIDTVEYLDICFVIAAGNRPKFLVKEKDVLTGSEAWEYRWGLLKYRLGWK